MADLLLAEEFFLLTHDDETGKPSSAVLEPDSATAGALLLDLAEHGAMTIVGKHVQVADVPVKHPLLERARTAIVEDGKERSVSHWVHYLPTKLKKLQDQVGESLVDRGILGREEGKMLGLFTYARWPERDGGPERQLRAGLVDVLVRGATPTPHQEMLVPLLQSQDMIHTLVEKDDRKVAKSRAKELAEAAKDGKLVSTAVSETVQATQVAVMTAVMVPVIVSST